MPKIRRYRPAETVVVRHPNMFDGQSRRGLVIVATYIPTTPYVSYLVAVRIARSDEVRSDWYDPKHLRPEADRSLETSQDVEDERLAIWMGSEVFVRPHTTRWTVTSLSLSNRSSYVGLDSGSWDTMVSVAAESPVRAILRRVVANGVETPVRVLPSSRRESIDISDVALSRLTLAPSSVFARKYAKGHIDLGHLL